MKGLGMLAAMALLAGCPFADDDDEPSGDDSTGDDDTGDDDTGDDDTAGDDTSGDDDSGDDDGWDPYCVLSLNLHCLKTTGTSYGTNAERMAAVAQAANAENVAAIAVQEACDDGQQAGLDLLEGALEDATGQGWSSAWAHAHVAWEGTPDEADEGVGLVVRGTLGPARTVEYVTQGALRRVEIAAELPPSLGSLTLHSLHLEVGSEDARVGQARQSAAWALGAADPSLDVILAGDLNATAGSAPHGALTSFGFQDATAALDPGRIDHVLVHRGAAAAVTDARLIFTGDAWAPVSDHPGALVCLAPAEPAPPAVTRVTAAVDVGWGHHLAVRGDTEPLSWAWGWPAYPVADDRWTLVLTELPEAPFQYKFLLDDAQWQAGDDLQGQGGGDHESAPQF